MTITIAVTPWRQSEAIVCKERNENEKTTTTTTKKFFLPFHVASVATKSDANAIKLIIPRILLILPQVG